MVFLTSSDLIFTHVKSTLLNATDKKISTTKYDEINKYLQKYNQNIYDDPDELVFSNSSFRSISDNYEMIIDNKCLRWSHKIFSNDEKEEINRYLNFIRNISKKEYSVLEDWYNNYFHIQKIIFDKKKIAYNLLLTGVLNLNIFNIFYNEKISGEVKDQDIKIFDENSRRILIKKMHYLKSTELHKHLVCLEVFYYLQDLDKKRNNFKRFSEYSFEECGTFIDLSKSKNSLNEKVERYKKIIVNIWDNELFINTVYNMCEDDQLNTSDNSNLEVVKWASFYTDY